ncbi:MAG: NarK family nitrate/nitrite MFS transporter [Castellaniella sp.]|uniref:NarK family nitrate/nitrite MFS transporter n=1 Tax=Castellaniella sp. TaxID=1955812 RepID=UPI002A37184D|nr:NarK family nitrate/nitrite MFS transporter [Castellaniella sp.]MDY0308389.1 NarK family nitrate/nitrite MFS transporter [Castellaniella sp.]
MSLSSPDALPKARRGRLLTVWTPEDKAFWVREGSAIANVNLWISIPALFLAFAVWQMWSVVAVNLPNLGFHYTENELFWLAALPALSGATLRIFYSFMVPVFGGRRWTALTTASLLLPTIGVGLAVQDPSTPYSTMLILALLCGLGGGNFSSSMSNISFFFPKERKGSALGLNAGLGNLGVSSVQFLAPLVISLGILGPWAGGPQMAQLSGSQGGPVEIWAQNAAFIWVPFIIIASMLAWVGMHDIADAKASFRDQAVIFKRKHNWIMCFLYLGTFGSFIGFSAGFPLLIKYLYPDIRPLQYAWLGPLVGAMSRPFGGWLSDRLGGARVTFWTFLLMVLGVLGAMASLPSEQAQGSFYGFLLSFLFLFFLTGIGNGSTFAMIPAIFNTLAQRRHAADGAAGQELASTEGAKESAAVLGFSGAMGAYGGFFIPKSFGTSFALTGTPYAALLFFVVFYAVSLAVTWWYYSRRRAEIPC